MDIIDVRTSRPKTKSGFSSLEKILICLAVLFGIIAIAMIIAFAKYDDGVCKTPACVKAASRIITTMDPTADPCKDFFQYACGGWLKKNVIPDTASTHDNFAIIRREIEEVLKNVLEKTDSNDIPAVQKAKIFYQSCIDENTKNIRKGEPLIKMLPEISDWPVALDNWEEDYGTQWSFEKTNSILTSKYGKSGLIAIYVTVDFKDTNVYSLYIDHSKLLLPSRDYYQCNGTTAEVCSTYMEQMISVAKLIRNERNLSIDDDGIRAQVEKVLELEKDIANAETPDVIRANPNNVYKKMSLAQVEKEYPLNISGKAVNWLSFVNAVMSPGGITVDENEQVVVYASEYLKALATFINKYTKRDIQNYLAWSQIFYAVGDLSKEYKATEDKLTKIMYGISTEDPLWRTCVNYLNNVLEDIIGRLYVKEAFSGESKQVVKDLIAELRKAFLKMLDENKWMDDKTRKRAIMKASKVQEHIGYPDEIMNDDSLNEIYREIDYKANEYYENKLKNLALSIKKGSSRLRSKVDKNEWIVGAAKLNAFYLPTHNQIVFPAGILQPPFFSSSEPKYMIYGGIGMVIGHEFTHGFDETGKNFDEDGALMNWWSNHSMTNFNDLKQCFVHQYGSFSWDVAGGKKLNGLITLSENIADNGGLRESYRAYQDYVRIHGKEKKLPSIDMNTEQLFFISLGQVWCGMYRPEYAVTTIATSTHSPNMFRVNGVLQNFPEFSQAFSCSSGDYMNPPKKCHLW
ncbi:neprilysin-like [Bombina bombina]|uniref:neprilysin-like n=1 Tax=Bombina bombina TaxID=8345 RepID=UPI00235AE7AE|nr:neprilysin-like [Bombina bombina]